MASPFPIPPAIALLSMALGWMTLGGQAVGQDEIVLTPVKDNTIYQESGSRSNGSGEYLYVGRTSGFDGTLARRALLKFDLERAIPRDARILNVSLAFHTSEAPIGGSGTEVFLFRALRAWGESASDAGDLAIEGAPAQQGDATWTHAHFDVTPWQDPGGDFAAAPSANVSVGRPLTKYEVKSTAALENDVQAWLGDPDSNYGWILIGDEVRESTTRRVNGRFHRDVSTRPRLTVTFSTPTSAETPDRPTGMERSFELSGISPNPVRASGTVRYALDRPQSVRLVVYDVTGRPVYTAEQRGRAGRNEMVVDAEGLPSGFYIYCVAPESSTRRCRTMTRIR